MTWPSHNDFVRQRMDDYFARNMTRQYFEDQEKRNRERAREAETRKYSSSTSSRESKIDRILTQDTPVSLALERKLAERHKQDYLLLTSSNSLSFIGLLKSCFSSR